MGTDQGISEHHRPADGPDEPGAGRPRPITLDSGELAGLLLEMGRAATEGELGVYPRDELERARESGYAQGWQDAMRYVAEQGGADPQSTTLADVIALIDSPLPSPRASDLRAQEPLMPHRKRKPGGDQRSG
ncbi:hypothetical protein M1P56_32450 [Streptomyces sp. HU2014]|uniref:Uncharacterized protein n=1 Tax=Streptomyces albireticuli TaxID=1940 RepID=A0A1Z2L3C4_9ACTN|nr:MULTISPECIES: hypothetical protein [Streptomyces]ARZ68800.1 hypothetical protein SMD11_3157 [Streptomyces albireticuli]UQI48691.1 hypothetical protein M1P56_32450 [Streptomyces sp. HU2014]